MSIYTAEVAWPLVVPLPMPEVTASPVKTAVRCEPVHGTA